MFRQYGLTAAICTDNGEPFASCGLGGLSRLSLWWIKQCIIPECIRPGHFEQNPRHERLHGSLKRGCAVQPNLRAHQSLERNQTPAMHYRHAERAYPARIPELSYPDTHVVKRVHPSGSIGWVAHRWYVTGLLRAELIGLKPVEDGVWIVFVGPVAVGRLDARATRIDPIESFVNMPTLH